MTLKDELRSIDNNEVEIATDGFVLKFGSMAMAADISGVKTFNEEMLELQTKYPALIGGIILGVTKIARGASESVPNGEQESLIAGAALACAILAEIAEVRELPDLE